VEGARAMNTLLALALIFAQLSLLAFGGGNTIFPEMQRQMVEVHHWMTARDFSAMFALAQAAPGPNMMIVTLLGWHIAGLPGVAVTTLASFGPCAVLTGLVMGAWDRFKDRPWRRIVQAGLVPVTVGLVAASAALITGAVVNQTPVLWLISAASAAIMLSTRLHPLWVLGSGALIGLSGVGLS
jgi:chromate transporter